MNRNFFSYRFIFLFLILTSTVSNICCLWAMKSNESEISEKEKSCKDKNNTYEQEIIKRFQVPLPLQKTLDSFFNKHNIIGDVHSIYKAFDENASLFKKVGDGCRVLVLEFPELDNKFVLKIATQYRLDFSSWKDETDPRSWFLSCRAKENVSRVLKAAKINEFIQAKGMRKIKAPQKYLYHLPGASTVLSDENYIVVSEKIDLDKRGLAYDAGKAQVFDFIKIMLEVDFLDTADGNMEIDKMGNFVIIDTDDAWIFMLQDNILKYEELCSLALFCAQKVSTTFKQAPVLEKLFNDSDPLKLQEVLTGYYGDRNSLKKIVETYKYIGILGAINTDVMGMYSSLLESDKEEILMYVLAEWVDIVCKKYNVSEENKKRFIQIWSSEEETGKAPE